MPGPHAFAVRVCAVRLARSRDRSRGEPPCDVVAPDAARVHRIPRSTFVTIAIRPSWSRRDGARKSPISEKQKRNIFAGGLDSRINVELLRKIRFYAQAIPSGRKGKTSALAVANNTSDLPVGQAKNIVVCCRFR
jgi:hypothetical protein